MLTRRLAVRPEGPVEHWCLPLQAHERSQLRGRRVCRGGQAVLLQLPRQEPLRPGEWLLPAPAAQPPVAVEVLAAEEPVLEIRASDGLALLQAAYHLGNRHVALELRRDELRLGVDSVLEDLLRHRGLTVERTTGPFLPEPGAYEPSGHAHRHSHGHHSHGHSGHSHP